MCWRVVVGVLLADLHRWVRRVGMEGDRGLDRGVWIINNREGWERNMRSSDKGIKGGTTHVHMSERSSASGIWLGVF